MFDHVIAALVHGTGYERLASPGCSDRTIRRRLAEAKAASARKLLRIGLAAYDRMLGLDLDDLSVDGSITKSPCGGEVSGRSPVARGKQGAKRSVAADGDGIPLHLVATRASDHDSPLLEPTLAGICDMIGPLPDQPCMHLDRGYDSTKTRDLLEILGYDAEIAVKGVSDGRALCARGLPRSADGLGPHRIRRRHPHHGCDHHIAVENEHARRLSAVTTCATRHRSCLRRSSDTVAT